MSDSGSVFLNPKPVTINLEPWEHGHQAKPSKLVRLDAWFKVTVKVMVNHKP